MPITRSRLNTITIRVGGQEHTTTITQHLADRIRKDPQVVKRMCDALARQLDLATFEQSFLQRAKK